MNTKLVIPFCEVCAVRHVEECEIEGKGLREDAVACCRISTTRFSMIICTFSNNHNAELLLSEIRSMFGQSQLQFFPYPKSTVSEPLLSFGKIKTESRDSLDYESGMESSFESDLDSELPSELQSDLESEDPGSCLRDGGEEPEWPAGHILFFYPELRHRLRRSGLPAHMRSVLWPVWTGASFLRQSLGLDYYANLLKAHENVQTDATQQIELDLHRTSSHEFFQNPTTGIAILRRILVAYSWKNPDIGYCQSMNIVCAALLLTMEEEQAFWTLCSICELYLPGTYAPTMVGARVNQKVFDLLLAEYLPAVSAQIVRLEPPIGLVCILPWFMCLFVGFLDTEDVYRFLDVFLLEGPTVLFRCALALFKYYEQEILAAEEGYEIIQALKPPFRLNWASLAQIAFGDFEGLDDDKISHLANCSKLKVIRELSQEAFNLQRYRMTKKQPKAAQPDDPTAIQYPDALDNLVRLRDSLFGGASKKKKKGKKHKLTKAEKKEKKREKKERKKKAKQAKKAANRFGSVSMSSLHDWMLGEAPSTSFVEVPPTPPITKLDH